MRNLNDYKRVISIGDIHGQYEKFKDLWEKIGFHDEEDLVILHGDYIDRGDGSVAVLQCVKSLVEQYKNVIALQGNHEDFMVDFFCDYSLDELAGRYVYHSWLDNGGEITLKELKKLDRAEVYRLLKFAQELPLYADLGECFFVHAGVNPYGPSEDGDYLWIRRAFLRDYKGRQRVVAGHTPVQYIDGDCRVPLLLPNNILLVDTGTALGCELSAVNVSDMTYIQSGAESVDWKPVEKLREVRMQW